VHGLSNIRLRYTGLVNFASQLFTIVTGFFFVITVTRNLTATEFGVWQNIGDILSYMTLLAGIIPFSTTRYMARGQRGAAKTGVITNTLLSLPMTSIFLLLAPLLASTIGTNTLYFQVASLQILLFYVLQVVESAVYAKAPHVLGYGTVLFEVTKLAIGVTLVTYLRAGLIGAIVAVAASQAVLSLFYVVSIRVYLREGANWSYLRSWWKITFVNLYGFLGDRLASLGLILLTLMWGAVARAYVGAALTIGVMISYSKALATALYPKLLAKTEATAVETSLKMTMLFAIPMTGGMIALSGSLLTVLKPDYAAASTILSIYAVAFLLDVVSAIFDTVITATERADVDEHASLKGLFKSKLFFLPTLRYVYAVLNLAVLVVLLKGFATEPFQASLYTSLASLSANVPIFLLRYRIAKKSLPFSLPLNNIIRYMLSTLLMMLVLSQIHLAATLSRIFILVLVGAMIYFGVVIVIEPETRRLIKTAVSLSSVKFGFGDRNSSRRC